ncbi:CHASE2 domain-containing protein [Leadbettera azotonutricia]|uniref:Adenylate/guanylate cyclase catalytic domain protein n=1 Tax=Leadbettera azotonutricia (strain ATCC BAA-888 / DSM 13862 / ZAS-9) TaxID=545695 RepID=F5YCS5_LEAAZ|nr:CHASE2 domain-containing protein [Leadbettera azotonutricia]AEF82305.1 adenylate/guanylate cyclase catalytic domain protein [Leadbettera azotonutricia ZAS-9]
MSLKKISILTAAGSALIFCLLYFTQFFSLAEDKVYDLFLRGRPERERPANFIFLDVDDQAIAHVGIFPWPRSVMADGLLRLKEYGVETAIFDIEYIDNAPTQVDEVYLKGGLKADFDRRFAEIESNISELLGAVAQGSIKGADAEAFKGELLDLIAQEKDALFNETTKVTRDNDIYLAQSMALFDRAWATLNLQALMPLEGEQASRRPAAEKKFSYPIKAFGGASSGSYVDVLPPIPLVMDAAQGAGFTNIIIDQDGIRRRLYPVRKVGDYWYLQLAFAPLVASMGNPELELYPGKLVIKKQGGDIEIPLDSRGAMLLDWPKTSYLKSYTHLSFAQLSYMEAYQRDIKAFLANLEIVNEDIFPAVISEVSSLLGTIEAAEAHRDRALENKSDYDFDQYTSLRNEAFDRIRALLDSGLKDYIAGKSRAFIQEYPEESDYIENETRYALNLSEYLETTLDRYEEIHHELKEKLKGKIIIIGRVDTGTTDLGVNPFHGEYVNVGTHGVMMDTVVSGSFIKPLNRVWSMLLCFALTFLVIFALTPVKKPGIRISLGFLGVMLVLGISFGLFVLRGIWLGPLGPALALLVAVVIRETAAFITSEKEKQFIRNTFSTYLSGDVVEEIVKSGKPPELGGEARYMTAVFTDVKGFSSISEALSQKYGTQDGAKALVRLLNRYLSSMSDVVLRHRGTIDKYEGDAIIAFFGAPQKDLQDHALRACASAIIMKRMENDLNAGFLAEGLSPYPLLTRIGINTGTMVVGNMGTQGKMDYTIMGNSVNLAARLEGVNKQYGTWILASQDTLNEAGDGILYRRLDKVRVVGIGKPVQLCEVMDIKAEAPEEVLERAALFDEALNLFNAKDWAKAQSSFKKVLVRTPDDEPSQIFIRRCSQYQKEPPPEKWDGVYNINQK